MNIKELIYEAIEKEDIKEVKRLLNLGIELSPEDYAKWKVEHSDYPLYRACENDEIAVVKYLIKSGHIISDNELITCIYVAVKNSNLEIAELLIESGILDRASRFSTWNLISLMVSEKCHSLLWC